MSKKLHRASTGKADPALYVRLFQNATVDTSHWNKWITTECWIDIIKAKYNVDVSLDLTSVGLNRALGSHPTYKAANIDMVASTNGLGVYRSRYKKKVLVLLQDTISLNPTHCQLNLEAMKNGTQIQSLLVELKASRDKLRHDASALASATYLMPPHCISTKQWEREEEEQEMVAIQPFSHHRMIQHRLWESR